MNTTQSDTKHHRIVTAVMIACGLLIYLVARSGLLGDALERFSTVYLVLVLILAGIRAILTEAGIRRSRFPFERR
jgi:cadmium resistance protein CadD (predicted permease)